MHKIISNNSRKYSFHFVFILMLYLLIVIFSLMIILLGKDIYSSINHDRRVNYERRVSLSYVANKIRQNDKEESIRIESLNGENTIVITEDYDGDMYETWIYFYDNAIYEMFTDAGMEFNLEDGIKVLEIDGFKIEEIKNDLYRFTAIDQNEKTELILNLHSN